MEASLRTKVKGCYMAIQSLILIALSLTIQPNLALVAKLMQPSLRQYPALGIICRSSGGFRLCISALFCQIFSLFPVFISGLASWLLHHDALCTMYRVTWPVKR